MRWISKDSPAWAAEMEKHQRMRRYKQTQERTIPLTQQDYILTVQNAPQKAANLFADYRSKVQALNEDHMVPESGKLIESGRMRDAALKQAEQLRETVAVAADLAKKKLAHDRDKARPKVDHATHERKARQLLYLVEKGTSVETLIRNFGQGNPELLTVLAEEAPIFAQAEAPLDPQAAEVVEAQIQMAAYETFGDEYKARADAISAFSRGAYRADVALAATIRQLRQDDRGDLAVPAYEEGELIEA